MTDKYLIYYQTKSGVVKRAPVFATHKEKARKNLLENESQSENHSYPALLVITNLYIKTVTQSQSQRNCVFCLEK